eukprot:570633-Hanusia_phi.AAC.1
MRGGKQSSHHLQLRTPATTSPPPPQRPSDPSPCSLPPVLSSPRQLQFSPPLAALLSPRPSPTSSRPLPARPPVPQLLVPPPLGTSGRHRRLLCHHQPGPNRIPTVGSALCPLTVPLPLPLLTAHIPRSSLSSCSSSDARAACLP